MFREQRSALVAIVAASVVVLAIVPGAAAAGPTATMTPASGLVDGQRTTIHGSGFPSHVELQVLECIGTARDLPRDDRSCEGDTLDSTGYTDAQGNYLNAPGDPSGDTQGYRISTLPSATFKVVSIHCGPTDPCLLYVGTQFNDFTKPHVFVPFQFAGAPAKSSNSTWVIVLVAVVAVVLVTGFVLLRRRRGGAAVATR
jgi:hypothetical protein